MTRAIRSEFTAAVAGISHYQDAALGAEQGQALDVKDEPDNPYDKDAKALYLRGQKVGYVPAEVAKRMGQGANWQASIADVLHGPGVTGLRVRFAPVRAHEQGTSQQQELGDPQFEETAIKDHRDSIALEEDERETNLIAKRQTVYAISGRALGELERVENNTAYVRVNERVIAYPAKLVQLPDTQ